MKEKTLRYPGPHRRSCGCSARPGFSPRSRWRVGEPQRAAARRDGGAALPQVDLRGGRGRPDRDARGGRGRRGRRAPSATPGTCSTASTPRRARAACRAPPPSRPRSWRACWLDGASGGPGVHPPEALGREPGLLDRVLAELEAARRDLPPARRGRRGRARSAAKAGAGRSHGDFYVNERPGSGRPGADTLPARYYTDPELFQREMEAIHYDMWLCAGPHGAAPGARPATSCAHSRART